MGPTGSCKNRAGGPGWRTPGLIGKKPMPALLHFGAPPWSASGTFTPSGISSASQNSSEVLDGGSMCVMASMIALCIDGVCVFAAKSAHLWGARE